MGFPCCPRSCRLLSETLHKTVAYTAGSEEFGLAFQFRVGLCMSRLWPASALGSFQNNRGPNIDPITGL